ncbi:unnamed protein product [Clavelina lepadiformis]|uniref:Phosphatidylinositol transfer protein N-terminal domain-containing protein n=1 Tax=Clavelina lepadiformis TaxID=159417 RepID=A0ABP0FZX6_CLALP
MLRKEFRIVLPVTVKEYQTAQLWGVAEASKNETGGGEGIEVIKNEPYEKDGESGQYTKKIYHLASRIPSFVRFFVPEGLTHVVEESWNVYPHYKTVYTNPTYMKENFEICLLSLHLPDLGTSENVHKLSPEEWNKTEVIKIDIVNDPINSGDYSEESDPKLFKSKKANRGPFGTDWIDRLRQKKEICQSQQNSDDANIPAYMCAYKLVSCKFKVRFLQNRVESTIMKQEQRLFTNFHRQLVCWMDKWYGITMEEIRVLENETKKELDELRNTGEIRGMKVD